MKIIRTEIIIDAPVSTVWNTLIDFSKYPDWNPFLRIEGRPEVGRHLKNTVLLEGRKPQVFRPLVLKVETEREFRWEGNLWVKGVFDGEHYFLLEGMPDGRTRFIHGENFRGILAAVILNMIGKQTGQSFEKMNAALKKRSEEVAVR